jgi:hypothetical protein
VAWSSPGTGAIDYSAEDDAFKYLTWTDDNLLRQVVYEGLRGDKDPAAVCRPLPNQSPLK